MIISLNIRGKGSFASDSWWGFVRSRTPQVISKTEQMGVLILLRMALSHTRSQHGMTIDYWIHSNNLNKYNLNCSFCWYWWNWWPQLFTLSFHIHLYINKGMCKTILVYNCIWYILYILICTQFLWSELGGITFINVILR